MTEVTGSVDFTEDEMLAIGLVLMEWRAQEVGVSFLQAMALMAALSDVDHGVMRACIDRVVLKMSVIEEEVFGRSNGLFEAGELRDKRAQIHANLDQAFARFEDEGRQLFNDTDTL